MLVKYHCLIYKSFVHSSHDDIMYVFEYRSTEHHENLKPLTCSDISHLFLKIDSYFSIVYIFWITIICQCKFDNFDDMITEMTDGWEISLKVGLWAWKLRVIWWSERSSIRQKKL